MPNLIIQLTLLMGSSPKANPLFFYQVGASIFCKTFIMHFVHQFYLQFFPQLLFRPSLNFHFNHHILRCFDLFLTPWKLLPSWGKFEIESSCSSSRKTLFAKYIIFCQYFYRQYMIYDLSTRSFLAAIRDLRFFLTWRSSGPGGILLSWLLTAIKHIVYMICLILRNFCL